MTERLWELSVLVWCHRSCGSGDFPMPSSEPAQHLPTFMSLLTISW